MTDDARDRGEEVTTTVRPRSRRALLATAGAGMAAVAGCLGSGDGGDGDGGNGDGGNGDGTAAWRTTELTDVRSGEQFTVADLPTPVVLETFAVWCSTCLSQQRELRTLLGQRPEVTAVTLNVDPNEDADRVRSHLEKHGFDWRYAVSPSAMTDSLVDAFGSSMTVPPRAPVVVVCADGASRLDDGVKSADRLAAALDECDSQ